MDLQPMAVPDGGRHKYPAFRKLARGAEQARGVQFEAGRANFVVNDHLDLPEGCSRITWAGIVSVRSTIPSATVPGVSRQAARHWEPVTAMVGWQLQGMK